MSGDRIRFCDARIAIFSGVMQYDALNCSESVNCIHLAERRKETSLLRANFLAWPVNFLASRSLAPHPFSSPLTHRSYFLARAEFLLDSRTFLLPDMTNFWIAQRSTNNEAGKRLLPEAYFVGGGVG